MALLFRSNYTKKYQVGGTIPYYASYQFKPVSIASYDPSALLQKYQALAAQKEKVAEPKIKLEAKDVAMPELDGLDNDKAYAAKLLGDSRERIVYGANNIAGFGTDAPSIGMVNDHTTLASTLPSTIKASKIIWDESRKKLQEQDGSKQRWFHDGKFAVAMPVLTKDNKKTGEFIVEYKTPKEVDDEGLQPLKYEDMVMFAAKSKQFTRNDDIRIKLGDGMSLSHIDEKILRPAFSQAKESGGKTESSVGGFFDKSSQQVIKELASGHMTQSNIKSLDHAVQGAISSLQTSGAWDNILAASYLQPVITYDAKGKAVYAYEKDEKGNDIVDPQTGEKVLKKATTYDEAYDNAKRWIILQAAKHQNVKTEDSFKRMFDFKEGELKRGNYYEKLKGNVSPVALGSSIIREFKTIEIGNGQTITIPVNEDPAAGVDLKPGIITNTDPKKGKFAHGFMDNAKTVFGEKLNQKTKISGGNSNWVYDTNMEDNFANYVYVTDKTPIFTMIPVDKKGKVLSKEALSKEGLQKARYEAGKYLTANPGLPEKEKLRIRSEFINKQLAKEIPDIRLQPTYVLEGVVSEYATRLAPWDINRSMHRNSNVSSSVITDYMEQIGDKGDVSDNANSKNFYSFDIFVPATPLYARQTLGKNGEKIPMGPVAENFKNAEGAQHQIINPTNLDK